MSFYFGYAKTQDGLKPYLDVYPDCPRYKLEKDLGSILRKYNKINGQDQKIQIFDLIEKSGTNKEFKEEVVLNIKYEIESLDEYL